MQHDAPETSPTDTDRAPRNYAAAQDAAPPKEAIYAVAAWAAVDARTAARALRHGPGVIRTRVVRDRVRSAMLGLGYLASGAEAG